MKRLYQWIRLGWMSLALAAGMTVMAGQSVAPALAAGKTIYVDDDGVQCPGAQTSLPGAITALGSIKTDVTIIVCQGTYVAASNAVSLTGYTNLKIVGKDAPLIDASSGFGGQFIHVTSSTSVTISGLEFLGAGNLSTSANATAISFDNTTGTISGNDINGWHQDYTSPLTHIDDAIDILTTSASQKVTIERNSLFDIQDNGIALFGPGKFTVGHNHVFQHNDVTPIATFGAGPIQQAGIILVNGGSGSTISDNMIEGNAGLEPICSVCLLLSVGKGIALVQSSSVKVTGNTIVTTGDAITVESWCYLSGSSNTLADSNTISGNKLTNNHFGVLIQAHNYYGTACTAHADSNSVKSNTINDDGDLSRFAAIVNATSPDVSSGNKITSNTISGYPFTPFDVVGTGVSGTVTTPNTVNAMPVTGF